MNTLDCRQHKCPYPVVEIRKLIRAQPGAPVQVLVGDTIARDNISRLASTLGYGVAISDTEGGFALNLTKTTGAPSETGGVAIAGKTVAFFTADTLGQGDDELGRILLRNFIMTLSELDQAPDMAFFVNSAVKLTCAGSETLEALDKLACMGTDIASCGLCLDFFGIKDKLVAGRPTNMLDIVDNLSRAGRIIRP